MKRDPNEFYYKPADIAWAFFRGLAVMSIAALVLLAVIVVGVSLGVLA